MPFPEEIKPHSTSTAGILANRNTAKLASFIPRSFNGVALVKALCSTVANLTPSTEPNDTPQPHLPHSMRQSCNEWIQINQPHFH